MHFFRLSSVSRLCRDSLLPQPRNRLRTVCRALSINLKHSDPHQRHSLLPPDKRSCEPQQCHHFHSSISSMVPDKHHPPLKATEITENEYDAYSEETLDSLTEFFEDLPETETCNEEYDCAYGNGVLNLHLGCDEGTYVINKQSPNKQIWLSSPLSGPKRFDYFQGQWIYLRDGGGLHKLLEDEIHEITGIKINLKKCKFYSVGVKWPK